MSIEIVRRTLADSEKALQDLLANDKALQGIADAGALLVATFKSGGRVFSCGNGGSMSDAMHFAEELTGRFRQDRSPLPATAISDAGHISCVANDFGYDFIFSRYIEAHGRKGDCLLAISTSGKSRNVLNAVEIAKKQGVKVIGMTGPADSLLAQAADICIATPGGDAFADRVQELHIKAIHIMIELVERGLFPENYKV